MQCQSCYKLCSTDTQVNDTTYNVDTETGIITITVDAALVSGCCGDEVATGEVELSVDMKDFHTCGDDELGGNQTWDDDTAEDEAEIEEKQETYEVRGKRKKDGSFGKPQKRTRKVYVVKVDSTIKCLSCKQDVTFSAEDQIDFEQSY